MEVAAGARPCAGGLWLHTFCCERGGFQDDLGPPVSREAALRRFAGVPTILASPFSPYWVEETTYGTERCEALQDLVGTERQHALVRFAHGAVASLAICCDDVDFLQRFALAIASTNLKNFPEPARQVSSGWDASEPREDEARRGGAGPCRFGAAAAEGKKLDDDPKDVEGWMRLGPLMHRMAPMIRLGAAEACFRGLNAWVVAPHFPYRVRRTSFGTAECRAWCEEARAEAGGLTVIVGLDRAYPTWIAVCGRSARGLSHRRGLHDYVSREDWAARPLDDERAWIERRMADEYATTYVKRWWPAS